MNKLLTIVLLAIILNTGFTQIKNVKFYTNNKTNLNELNIDDFYLSHYLYLDLFLRENLYTEANENEVAYILKNIKAKASIKFPLDVEIKLGKKGIYKLRIKIVEKDAETLFIAFTNYNLKSKKFEKDISGDSYTRWYFLNGNKMTYRKDMSRENDYDSMNKIDLANAYLFDEIVENDNDIENTVQDGKKTEDDLFQIFIGDLVLLKNSIYKRNKTKTVELIESIESNIKNTTMKEGIKSIESAFEITKFQIDLMNIMN